MKFLQIVLLSIPLVLTACGGGGSSGGSAGSSTGDSGGSSSSTPGSVSFGISDAPVEDLAKVVITIDGIELKPQEGDDCDDDLETDDCVFIDHFTDGDLTDQETVTVDLLEWQGTDKKIIVEGIELPAGKYGQLRLSVIDEDINFSYVEEQVSGEQKLLKVPSDTLKLGGFTVESGGVQVIVIEFDLRKAMTYNPGPDRYILKPTGVRVVEVETAASISGEVHSNLFNGNGSGPCSEKLEPTVGNLVYVYEGHHLQDATNLADNFDDSSAPPAPADAIAPFSSKAAAADGTYDIGYLPAGDYTLAFSCEAEGDNADRYDGIVIPSPATEIVELTLGEGESKTCDFPIEGGDC
jgi:hypothetical protein